MVDNNLRLVQKKAYFLFALFISSTIYTTKISLSPVYFGVVLLFSAAFLTFISKRKNSVDIKSVGDGILMVIVSILPAIYSVSNGSKIQDVMNFLFGPFIYIATVLICSNVPLEAIKKASVFFIKSSLFIFFVELIFRLAFFDVMYLAGDKLSSLAVDDSFYNYKFASFMYEDSNYVGLQLVVLIGFSLCINRIVGKKLVGMPLFLQGVLLVIGSLSRASMVATLLICFFYFLRNANRITKLGLTFFVAMIFLPLSENLINDESFQSKIGILLLIFDNVTNLDARNLLAGSGIGMTSELIGIGAHNILALIFSEAGLFYSAIFGVFILRRAFRKSTNYVALGFLINGFSLATFAIPYLYLCLAILEQLDKKQAEAHAIKLLNMGYKNN